jgi:hypothetical protein
MAQYKTLEILREAKNGQYTNALERYYFNKNSKTGGNGRNGTCNRLVYFE